MKITPLRIIVCALALGLGHYYYTNVFRWRILEDPYADPTVEIKERDSAVLYPFRKRTVADIIDPTLKELARLERARATTNKGKYNPNWDSDESLARQLEIMEQARLRRIPKRYSKDYDDVLWGIYHAYLSTRALQKYAKANDPKARKIAYKECYDQYNKAQRMLCKARDYFHDNPVEKELAPTGSNP